MEQQVKITAEILQHDRSSCRFTVERPVLAGRFARFRDAEQSKGSPLAEAIFAVPGVLAVMIKDEEITVTHQPPVDWRKIGPLVGAAIRAFLESGKPAVAEEVFKNAPAEDVLRQKVERILAEQINPQIAEHDGYISLLDVKERTIFIKMGGRCQGCGKANATLRDGVEAALRHYIPEIEDIFDTTDHASGRNPYFAAHAH